ncbi:MAG: MBL fold metallo-hydrolase [Thermomicrobiales bacterium]
MDENSDAAKNVYSMVRTCHRPDQLGRHLDHHRSGSRTPRRACGGATVASEDWPSRIDVVLISHMHWDHLDLPTLRDIGKEKLLFVPRGAGEWLDKRGFSNVRELG